MPENADASQQLDYYLSNPRRVLLKLVLVVSVSYIVIKANGFLDTYWITNISRNAVAAVSSVSTVYSTVSALGVGLGTGACICIQYRIGKKDVQAANRMCGTQIYLGALSSIPVILFLLFCTNILYRGADEQVRELTVLYLTPLQIGSPLVIMQGILANFLKSEGSMRTMTLCTMASIPVNAVLSPILIIVLDWGIMGASIATVMGQVASNILIAWQFRRGGHILHPAFCRPTLKEVKEILLVGGPKTIEEFTGGALIMFVNVIILHKLGADGLAIFSLAFSFPYLLTIISDSVAAQAQPMCSTLAGQGMYKEMRSMILFSANVIRAVSAVALVVLLFIPELILQIFLNSDVADIKDDLVHVTRVMSLTIPPYLMCRYGSSMLQVVRKAHIWVPIYLTAIACQALGLYFFVTNYVETAISVIATYGILAVLVFFMIRRYVLTYRGEPQGTGGAGDPQQGSGRCRRHRRSHRPAGRADFDPSTRAITDK